ncbi:MAG: homocysteine S-methyltransferase family protein [Pseudomonadota bacterium]
MVLKVPYRREGRAQLGEITINSDLVILDGGMGAELQRRAQVRSELWSAQALLDAPDTVAAVHQDYVAAGAQIIITNNYSTIPSYLAKAGLAERYLELTRLAGEIARRAVQAPVQVAGSLPPLDESYRWDLVPSDEDARPIYLQLAQALNPYVDLFVCETMSCSREAYNALSAAREVAGFDKPAWVAWTLDERPGHGLRSGETIAEAMAVLADLRPDAYLFNCTTPEAISAGLAELATLTDKPTGAYPNRFFIPEGWTLDNEVATQYRDMEVGEYVEFCRQWRSLGARYIGGCCGIGPEFIAALAAEAL